MRYLQRIKQLLSLFGIAFLFLATGSKQGICQSSEKYSLERYVVAGGFQKSTSDNYSETAITGQPMPTGTASSENYDVSSGYITPENHVGIDIKPDDYPNTINLKSKGMVPVAIFGSMDFDVTTVDTTTVILAGVPVKSSPNGRLMASFDDVNSDGYLDLVVHFDTQSLLLDVDATEIPLEGSTVEDGIEIRFSGIDSAIIIIEAMD